jgi:hypothetical protein
MSLPLWRSRWKWSALHVRMSPRQLHKNNLFLYFKTVVLGSLKSFFQLDYQVHYTYYLNEATALCNSRELTFSTPSWCTSSPISLLASWTLKSISCQFISLHIEGLPLKAILILLHTIYYLSRDIEDVDISWTVCKLCRANMKTVEGVKSNGSPQFLVWGLWLHCWTMSCIEALAMCSIKMPDIWCDTNPRHPGL